MSDNRNLIEIELREQVIKAAIKYYDAVHKNENKLFTPGDRITYGGRVFDEREITNLIDSSLDFWLTTGRFAKKFETEFASFLGVKYCSLSKFWFICKFISFYGTYIT